MRLATRWAMLPKRRGRRPSPGAEAWLGEVDGPFARFDAGIKEPSCVHRSGRAPRCGRPLRPCNIGDIGDHDACVVAPPGQWYLHRCLCGQYLAPRPLAQDFPVSSAYTSERHRSPALSLQRLRVRLRGQHELGIDDRSVSRSIWVSGKSCPSSIRAIAPSYSLPEMSSEHVK